MTAERARRVLWGPVDQLLSSVTNFALSVAAGRVLGSDGLGVVFVSFSAYLLALGFQRALIADPLVVTSSTSEGEVKERATRCALTWCLAAGCLASIVFGAAGAITPGVFGRGIGLVAPWMVPLLVQDFWRTVLFRDRRGVQAALNDGAWLLAMLLGAPFFFSTHSEAAIIAWWGVGAAAGAVLGSVQTSTSPAFARTAVSTWWRRHWVLGRWLWLESVVFSVGEQCVVFALATILGPAALGGLRAVTSLFSPLSFIKPALTLPGLPVVARAVTNSSSAGRALAAKLSGAAVAAAIAYVFVVGAMGESLLNLFFGRSFVGFESLILPVAVGQIALASAVGFFTLLKAEQRGTDVLLTGATTSVASLVLAPVLAYTGGLLPAAWGLSAAGLSGAGATVLLAVRRRPSASSHSASNPVAVDSLE